jgi:hypothetical protein
MIIDEYSKIIDQQAAKIQDMQAFVDNVLFHNNWLWYMHGRLDKIVWYDEVEHLRIPEIGLDHDISTWSDKHHVEHAERVKKYFTDPDAVLQMSQDLQDNFNGIIGAVRKRYGR